MNFMINEQERYKPKLEYLHDFWFRGNLSKEVRYSEANRANIIIIIINSLAEF